MKRQPIGHWIHAFEEDAGGDEVYRPLEHPFSLTRRPREQLVLHEGGKATVYSGGPSDRPLAREARWTPDPDGVVVRLQDAKPGDPAWRVVEHSPERIVVRRLSGDEPKKG